MNSVPGQRRLRGFAAPHTGGLGVPLSQDYVTIASCPEADREGHWYVGGPSIARLADGRLLAAVTINRRLKIGNQRVGGHIIVATSGDGGKSWRTIYSDPGMLAEVMLFVHRELLYLFLLPRSQTGIIEVTVSNDGGATWREPVRVVEGIHGKYDSTHLGTVVCGDRFYWALSDYAQEMVVACCNLKRGILNPKAWSVSNAAKMPIPAELDPGLFPKKAGGGLRCLEGNVIHLGGRLRVLARAQIDSQGTANIAAVFDLKHTRQGLKASFSQFHALPGGQCKFFILHDDVSDFFWMASNMPANSQNALRFRHPKRAFFGSPGNDRRFLLLWYSCDATNWFPAGFVACAEKLNQSFMYPSMLVDGDDLVLVARTSVNGPHQHDADALTFHRVKKFRSLAVDIRPTL